MMVSRNFLIIWELQSNKISLQDTCCYSKIIKEILSPDNNNKLISDKNLATMQIKRISNDRKVYGSVHGPWMGRKPGWVSFHFGFCLVP